MGKRHQGSATVEVFIVSLVAVPLLIVLQLLGNQLDAKHKTAMAARYAVWERTVWSDSGSSWRNGEGSKSDADISLEVDGRVNSNPRAHIADVSHTRSVGFSSNPLWTDWRQRSLLGNAGVGASSRTTIDEGSPPVSHGFLVTELASAGRAGGFLKSFTKSIGLNTNNYVTAHVELPWKVDFPDEDLLTYPLAANAAILSDAWSPSDEGRFHDRVAGLTIDDELRVLELGTYTFGYFDLFKEGKYGRNADLVPSSSVVPQRFIR